jgi:hypothetical protein
LFGKKKEALLFLKKKAGRPRKQKDFFNLGHGRWKIQPPERQKFLTPFLKKSGYVPNLIPSPQY